MKLKIGATTKDGSTASQQSWTKQDIIGTPSVSESGNAVTGMTVSGDTVTLTKGTTFATKAQNDALDQRVSALEDFTGGTGGGQGDQLNVAGYDVVRFDGFLASKPTLQQTSTTSVVALVIVKSATPSTTPGAMAIDSIIASDGSKYYGNWKDFNIATPDEATKKQVHLHKIYLDTSTGGFCYAVDATTLKEIDAGDVAMTPSEVDAQQPGNHHQAALPPPGLSNPKKQQHEQETDHPHLRPLHGHTTLRHRRFAPRRLEGYRVEQPGLPLRRQALRRSRQPPARGQGLQRRKGLQRPRHPCGLHRRNRPSQG